jgi:hypothetical protein
MARIPFDEITISIYPIAQDAHCHLLRSIGNNLEAIWEGTDKRCSRPECC